jgi:transcriptional regulator GlxA family with amidase domain
MRKIAVVVYADFEVLDLAAMAAFELANKETGTNHYNVSVVSEAGGVIRSSFGVSVDSVAFDRASVDTVLVTGSIGKAPATPALRRYLRRQFASARRVASICTGAFILAEAGLLDGRRATTHWNHARELRARFPRVRVQEDRIFTRDGKVWTSAGMTAGLDLALALVEEDLGLETTSAVARKLVVYHRRLGGQSQFSALLELQPQTDRMQRTLSYAKANLHLPLTVADLADIAHLSPRQFSRSFKLETGQSPARAIEQMRLEAARDMITSASHPLSVVASKTGFGDMERMRRAFVRTVGEPPRALRRTATSERAAAGL